MKPWDGIISEEDQAAYRAVGFGRSSGIGKKPALLIIDMQYRTTGTKPMPFDEAIKEYVTSCGDVAWDAMSNVELLLALFREKGWPILYPYVAQKTASDGGRLAEKIPAIMDIPQKGYDFPKQIQPQDGDILVAKKHPSAFFGTALTSYLIDLGVDTLVITGCSTSGCVRSSVVDAFSLNFKVLVPYDAVYDRSFVSHAVNLFDMSEKYADVDSTEVLLNKLNKNDT